MAKLLTEMPLIGERMQLEGQEQMRTPIIRSGICWPEGLQRSFLVSVWKEPS